MKTSLPPRICLKMISSFVGNHIWLPRLPVCSLCDARIAERKQLLHKEEYCSASDLWALIVPETTRGKCGILSSGPRQGSVEPMWAGVIAVSRLLCICIPPCQKLVITRRMMALLITVPNPTYIWSVPLRLCAEGFQSCTHFTLPLTLPRALRPLLTHTVLQKSTLLHVYDAVHHR